jgi:hypothetical protein
MSKSPLFEKVREVIRLRHYSIRTEEAYVQTIRRFILYHHKRHPREMGVDEIRQYLSHLATDGNVAASTQNVALCALLFLYRQVLRIDLPFIERIERAKRPKCVPVFSLIERVGKGPPSPRSPLVRADKRRNSTGEPKALVAQFTQPDLPRTEVLVVPKRINGMVRHREPGPCMLAGLPDASKVPPLGP